MPDSADDTFVSMARSILDGILERRPEMATELGDHRFDDVLTIATAAYHDEAGSWYARRLGELRALDLTRLSPQLRADALILANQLDLILFTFRDLREQEWNPMMSNPGRAIYLQLARDFAPLAERLRSVARRLAAVPEALAAARDLLGPMPRIHIETALSQLAGTAHLIGAGLDQMLPDTGPVRAEVLAARAIAAGAIDDHCRWLSQRLADGDRDGSFREPRIGADLFARKLRLTLETDVDGPALLSSAEADLARVTSEIAETAAELTPEEPRSPGLVRRALDRLAADAPDNATILDLVRAAFKLEHEFVRGHDIVTTFDDPVEVIEMPEIDRGVAAAYCDPPGPLETAPAASFVAVSPAPQDWAPERVSSFYREYNRHMVHNLMIHEGMPGHVLQLQHSHRFASATRVREALRSGSFIEGWAVYSEEVMAGHGYPGEGNPAANRLQQLKMQLRMIINTILDGRVHCDGMTEAAAMALMTGPGHQEEGEAAGKWRRALLTSAQMSTYYAGYIEVKGLATDLRRSHPGWTERQRHDTMLAHGSPAVRHLRELLGVGSAGPPP